MPKARVELARGCPRWILSPLRLPFRHSGKAEEYGASHRPGQVATKILAVPVADPWTAEISELATHTLREIEHFFLVYRDLGGAKRGQQESRGFSDATEAHRIIRECTARYETQSGPTTNR